MMTEEFKRACTNLQNDKVDFTIISSHENIVYISGFDTPLPIGAPTDFSGGLPLAIVILNVREENGHLIVADTYKELAKNQSKLENFSTFSIFNHFSPTNPVSNFVNSIKNGLHSLGLAGTSSVKIGVEFETLPAILLNLLNKEFPNVKIFNAKASLDRSRRIKTDREVKLLRHVASIADTGQQILVESAKNFSKTSEFDLWCKVKMEILKKANKQVPIPLVGELVTGPRTNIVSYPGGPIPRTINVGDTGIMDISIRVDGYWADCSNVVVFGDEPNREQKKYFKTAKDGFEAAVESLRPGTRCCDIENSVRKAFEKNGFSVVHYSGHQIGANVNETPRIVSYDKSVVEPGMVFCFEPGIYSGPKGKTGARLERMVLVKDSGAEILNEFPWGIE